MAGKITQQEQNSKDILLVNKTWWPVLSAFLIESDVYKILWNEWHSQNIQGGTQICVSRACRMAVSYQYLHMISIVGYYYIIFSKEKILHSSSVCLCIYFFLSQHSGTINFNLHNVFFGVNKSNEEEHWLLVLI